MLFDVYHFWGDPEVLDSTEVQELSNYLSNPCMSSFLDFHFHLFPPFESDSFIVVCAATKAHVWNFCYL